MTSDRVGEALFEAGEPEVPVGKKTPAGTSKTFRHYDPAQAFLLPPSLDDWLPEDHEARFIAEVVDELLDLSAIYDSYVEASGAPPYDPKMMLKLLVFAYSTGVTSSREMERRCHVDVAFRWLSANTAPDYRSLSRFRRRHLEALDDLFVQVLRLCAEAGLVKLGRIALDGTKIRASASKHKAMSHDRIVPKIEQLEREVADLLAEAEAADREEDDEFGEDRRGDEIPAELARRETRLAKLHAAKEAIEQEARDKAAQKARQRAQDQGADQETADEKASEAAEQATPEPRAQRSFTDPESRMMKTNDGFQHAYNAQNVVVPASPRGRIPKDATARERMGRRLRTKKGRADYARRKAIVEPVFGQMKVRQHAGFLRLRGLDGAQGEWLLHSICHNLRKLAQAG